MQKYAPQETRLLNARNLQTTWATSASSGLATSVHTDCDVEEPAVLYCESNQELSYLDSTYVFVSQWQVLPLAWNKHKKTHTKKKEFHDDHLKQLTCIKYPLKDSVDGWIRNL